MNAEMKDSDVVKALDGSFLVVSDGKIFDGQKFTDTLTVDSVVFDDATEANKALAEIAKTYDGNLDVVQYRDAESMKTAEAETARQPITEAGQALDATPALATALQQIKAAYQQIQITSQSIDNAIATTNSIQTKATKDNVIIDRLGVETNADPAKVVKTLSAHLPDLNNAKVSMNQALGVLKAPTQMASMFV